MLPLKKETGKASMYDRQWAFVADMNYSGAVTISDVWLWFKWLYFYPGDGLLYSIINGAPPIATFFEITFNSYSGFFSGFVSFFCWLFVLAMFTNLYNWVYLID